MTKILIGALVLALALPALGLSLVAAQLPSDLHEYWAENEEAKYDQQPGYENFVSRAWAGPRRPSALVRAC